MKGEADVPVTDTNTTEVESACRPAAIDPFRDSKADLQPGHYYVQLEITDKAIKAKEQPAVIQWVDFEIVNK